MYTHSMYVSWTFIGSNNLNYKAKNLQKFLTRPFLNKIFEEYFTSQYFTSIIINWHCNSIKYLKNVVLILKTLFQLFIGFFIVIVLDVFSPFLDFFVPIESIFWQNFFYITSNSKDLVAQLLSDGKFWIKNLFLHKLRRIFSIIFLIDLLVPVWKF